MTGPGPASLGDPVESVWRDVGDHGIRAHADPADHVRFAALQSAVIGRIPTCHGRDYRDLNTLYLVLVHTHPEERLLAKSDAARGHSPMMEGTIPLTLEWDENFGPARPRQDALT